MSEAIKFSADNIHDELKKISSTDLTKMSDEKRKELIAAVEKKLWSLTEAEWASGLKAKTVFRQIVSDIRRLDLDKTEWMQDQMQETQKALAKLGTIEIWLNTSKKAKEALKKFESFPEGMERNKAIIEAQKGLRVNQIIAEKFGNKPGDKLSRDELVEIAELLSHERFDLVYKEGGLIATISSDAKLTPKNYQEKYERFQAALQAKEAEAQQEAITQLDEEEGTDGMVRALGDKNKDFTVEADEDGLITRTHKQYGFTDYWNSEDGVWESEQEWKARIEEQDEEETETEKPKEDVAGAIADVDAMDEEIAWKYHLDPSYEYERKDGTLYRTDDAGTEVYNEETGDWEAEGTTIKDTTPEDQGGEDIDWALYDQNPYITSDELIEQYNLDSSYTYTKEDGMLFREDDAGVEYYDPETKEWKSESERRKLEDPTSQEYKDNMDIIAESFRKNWDFDKLSDPELPKWVTTDADLRILTRNEGKEWWDTSSQSWQEADTTKEGTPHYISKLNELAGMANSGWSVGDGVTAVWENVTQEWNNIIREVGTNEERWNPEKDGGSWETWTGDVTDYAVDGGTYTGPIKDGKPEGVGTLTDAQGNIYQNCNFVEGKAQWTDGTLIKQNGDEYTGFNFVEWKPTGIGSIKFKDDTNATKIFLDNAGEYDLSKKFTVIKANWTSENGIFTIDSAGKFILQNGTQESIDWNKNTVTKTGIFNWNGILIDGEHTFTDNTGWKIVLKWKFNERWDMYGEGTATYSKDGVTILEESEDFWHVNWPKKITKTFNGKTLTIEWNGSKDSFWIIGKGTIKEWNTVIYDWEISWTLKQGQWTYMPQGKGDISYTGTWTWDKLSGSITIKGRNGIEITTVKTEQEWDEPSVLPELSKFISDYSDVENFDPVFIDKFYPDLTLDEFIAEYDQPDTNDKNKKDNLLKAAKKLLGENWTDGPLHVLRQNNPQLGTMTLKQIRDNFCLSS